MTVERFGKDEFLAFLSEAHEEVQELGLLDGEYCFAVHTAPASRILLRSSVKGNGVSAESGKDSIRVILQVLRINSQGQQYWQAIAKGDNRWTTRKPGWQERTLALMEPLFKSKLNSPVGQECDCRFGGHAVFVNRTNPNNKKGNAYRIFVAGNRKEGCNYYKFGDTLPMWTGDESPPPSEDNDPPWEVEKPKRSAADLIAEKKAARTQKPEEQPKKKSLAEKMAEEEEDAEFDLDGSGDVLPEPVAVQKIINWSDEQSAYIELPWNEKIVMNAGPGSGKTATTAGRIMKIVDKDNIDPNRIFALTFTRTAAAEMGHRLSAMEAANIAEHISLERPDLRQSALVKSNISTIHAFCSRRLAQWGVTYNIPDGRKKRDIKIHMEKVIEDAYQGRKKPPVDEVMAVISSAKFNLYPIGKDVEYFNRTQGMQHGERLSRCRREFDAYMEQNGLWTFADQIYKFEMLLINDEDFRKWVQGAIDVLLIDEAQDTASSSFRILATSGGDSMVAYNGFFGMQAQKINCNKGFSLIGDIDQYLYAWAGADTRKMVGGLDEWFEGVRYMTLTINFRSVPEIVAAGDTCKAYNYEMNGGPLDDRFYKHLTAHREDHGRLWAAEYADPADEAAGLTQFIQRYVASGGEYDEIFVPARTRAYLINMHAALMAAEVPVINLAGGSFWKMRHIKAFVNYLRVAHEPDNQWAFMGILQIPSRHHKVYSFKERTTEYKGFRMYLGAQNFTKVWKTYADMVQDYDDLSYDEFIFKISGMKVRMKQGHIVAVYEAIEDIISVVEALQDRKDDPNAVLEYLIAEVMDDWIKYKDGQSSDVEGNKIDDLWSIGSIYVNRGYDGFNNFIFKAQEEEKRKKDGDWTGHVVLSTIHKLKGLQRRVVILIGASEGYNPKTGSDASILPHQYAVQGPPNNGVLRVSPSSSIADERCLFFVTLTRAEQYVVFSSVRDHRGCVMRPSRFIEEIVDHITFLDTDNGDDALTDENGMKMLEQIA